MELDLIEEEHFPIQVVLIVFGVDMSSRINATNRAKSFLILGKSLTRGLEDTTLHAEKMYSVKITL